MTTHHDKHRALAQRLREHSFTGALELTDQASLDMREAADLISTLSHALRFDLTDEMIAAFEKSWTEITMPARQGPQRIREAYAAMMAVCAPSTTTRSGETPTADTLRERYGNQDLSAYEYGLDQALRAAERELAEVTQELNLQEETTAALGDKLSEANKYRQIAEEAAPKAFAEGRAYAASATLPKYTLRWLQENLPWTLPYSEHFEATAYPLDRVKHDVLHVMKSLGRVAAECENHDHGRDRKLYGPALAKEVADFVICALHIAKLEGFDLEDAVIDNSSLRNGVNLRSSDGGKEQP